MSPTSFCPRATAASPLSSRTNAGVPTYDKIPRAAIEFVAQGKLTKKSSRTLHGLRRRNPAPVLALDHAGGASASSPPRHSPQNTDDPVAAPAPSLSATEAVEIQLRALENDDSPWQGHGVQTGEFDPPFFFFAFLERQGTNKGSPLQKKTLPENKKIH
jgi:hypothetical protein